MRSNTHGEKGRRTFKYVEDNDWKKRGGNVANRPAEGRSQAVTTANHRKGKLSRAITNDGIT
jgi:hypothetical protein